MDQKLLFVLNVLAQAGYGGIASKGDHGGWDIHYTAQGETNPTLSIIDGKVRLPKGSPMAVLEAFIELGCPSSPVVRH